MPWPTAVDAGGWMRKTERRIGLLERRPAGSSSGGGGTGGATTLNVVDTATLDLTLSGSPTVGYTLKGDVLGGTGGGVVDGKTIPAGVTVPWSGTGAVPSGWLLADGSAVSRTTYAALFAAIGTTYGVGDNSTTFNLPNMKGRTVVGQDAAQTEFDVLGEVGGTKAETLTTAQLPVDTVLYGGTSTYFAAIQAGNSAQYRAKSHTTDSNYQTAQNNLQPYIVQRYLISIGSGGTSSGSRGVVGEMLEWPNATAPEDFLLCQGQFVSTTTYADLYAVVGDKYIGSATTQAGMFRLPEMRTRVPLGADTTIPLGAYGGSQTHTLTVAEMPSHGHTWRAIRDAINTASDGDLPKASNSVGNNTGWGNTIVVGHGNNPLGMTGGGTPHNNMQPYTSVNFIIRYRTTSGVNDTKMAVQDTATVDLTLTGDGSPVTPYTVKADVPATAGLVPPGAIMAYAVGTMPLGWLQCTGQAVSRTTYAALFAVIGTVYGVGDNSTTFNLPNLLGRVVAMIDGSQADFNAVGKKGGFKETHHAYALPPSASGSFQDGGLNYQDAAIALLNTWLTQSGTSSASSRAAQVQNKAGAFGSTGENPTEVGYGRYTSSNLPPYIALNYIIKT